MPSVLVRLRPTGPWRIGPDSGDRDRVERIYHSDALYSAVCGAMARLGTLDEWLDATARAVEHGREPAVRFSSCFPFHNETLYVVPPQHLWPPPASSKIRWKGARFVPFAVVESLLAGKPPSEDAWTVDGESECLMPATATAGSTLFRASVRSSAAVDRNGDAATPHSVACLEFTTGSGFWFIAEFADDAAQQTWSERVKAAIRLLADSGFGGERSRGWGRSQAPEFREDPALQNRDGAAAAEGETGHWMLSLYHPAESDAVNWQRGNYSLTTRGGRVESEAGWGQLKKNTRMVAEGSVLVSSAQPRGAAANVAPDGFAHPVYRAGFALSLPVPLKVPA
jgi:CRISPR type III-A-associated RAMP protein Csm4